MDISHIKNWLTFSGRATTNNEETKQPPGVQHMPIGSAAGVTKAREDPEYWAIEREGPHAPPPPNPALPDGVSV